MESRASRTPSTDTDPRPEEGRTEQAGSGKISGRTTGVVPEVGLLTGRTEDGDRCAGECEGSSSRVPEPIAQRSGSILTPVVAADNIASQTGGGQR